MNKETGHSDKVFHIQYQPLIHVSPIELSTIYTVVNLLSDSGGKPIIVTFDCPLCVKAIEIGYQKIFQYRLDLVVFTKSFLGYVGYVLRGSGVEDIIKLISPGDSTADHIMKGSVYYKTLWSHFITENGAARTFDETELSSSAFEHIRNHGRTAALWL